MTWTTVTLRVTTPLFNGGADPDGTGGFRPEHEAGLRVASVRGAMRFWFRTLAGTVAGPDLRLLGAFEREVFGDADTPSAVQLRIPRQPRVDRTTLPAFLDGDGSDQDGGKWIAYLLGPGLTKHDKGAGRLVLNQRPFVPDGQELDLKLRFTTEPAGALALAALRLCCLYGGFGARARRGFGGVRIVSVNGPLPEPWSESALRGRGLADHAGVRALRLGGELAQCREILVTMGEDISGERPGPAFDDDWNQPPPYPVLSPAWSLLGVSGGKPFRSWQDTLCHAGKQLRYFRASEPNNRAGYKPKIETPEWKQVVHGSSDRFQVGALGLPVVFKDGYVVNVDRGTGPDPERLRRASPLWLRPVEANGDWRLLSFAFLGEYLPGPEAPGVHLWHLTTRDRQLHVTQADVRQLAEQWIRELRADRSFAGQARRQ